MQVVTPANDRPAIWGENSYSGTSDNVAVLGRSVNGPGWGYGGIFEGGYVGVEGVVPNSSYSANVYGVYGDASGTGGNRYGMYGRGSGDGNSYGAYGHAYSTGNAYGVGGFAYGTSGATAMGVNGRAEGNATTKWGGSFDAIGAGSANYGIRAAANGAVTNYAGIFVGDVHVGGTLSKTAGSFRIDHPLDPANKYLQHSFVESPDMMNVYNGNVVLDANGEATVSLPIWFEALNRDFRYQLTSIGAPGPNLYIAQKIGGNTFRIAGGASGGEVSWQVTGVRKDAYAEENRIAVEIDKSLQEQGRCVYAPLCGGAVIAAMVSPAGERERTFEESRALRRRSPE